MGALIRSLDWSRSPLGPIDTWPQSLRTSLGICLSSRFPMAIWWGPDIVQFYNDGYRPFLGTKHPRSMGQRGDECWAEIWNVCGPLYRHVMTTGESTWSADLQLLMERDGYLEETYFTFAYSPIRGERAEVLRNLITVTETTERMLGERGVPLGRATSHACRASGRRRAPRRRDAVVPENDDQLVPGLQVSSVSAVSFHPASEGGSSHGRS